MSTVIPKAAHAATHSPGGVADLSGTYATRAAAILNTGNGVITGGSLVLDWSGGTSSNAPNLSMYGYNGRWYAGGLDLANSPTSRDFVPVAKYAQYSINDAALTNSSATLTSAAEGNFVSSMVGMGVAGTGIPGGTTVTAVASATSLTMSNTATATASGQRVTFTSNGTFDLIYISHNGASQPTVGIGVTPPDKTAQLQVVVGTNSVVGLDGLRLIQGTASATGKYWRCTDSSNTDRLWVDHNSVMSGENNVYGAALVLQGDATNNQPLYFIDKTATYTASFQWVSSWFSLHMPSLAQDVYTVDVNGFLQIKAPRLGFFSAAAQTKPTVTGSKGSNAALTSLMAALSGLGLVTDSTT